MIIKKSDNYIKYNNYDNNNKQIKTKVEERLCNIDKLIKNYNNLDVKKKYELLGIIYDFYLEYPDFLQVLNYRNNNNYKKIVTLPLKMENEYIYTEGSGRDFSWWTIFIKFYLVCASATDLKMKKNYSINEIENLTKEGIIYPIDLKSNEIDKHTRSHEEYRHIDCFKDTFNIDKHTRLHFDNSNYNDLFLLKKNSDENTKDIMKIVDENTTLNKVFKDAKTNVKKLEKDLIDSYDYYCSWSLAGEEDYNKTLVKVRNYYNHNFKNK